MNQVWQHNDNFCHWMMGNEGALYFSFSLFVYIRSFQIKNEKEMIKKGGKKRMLWA